jgi:hypothetical protein
VQELPKTTWPERFLDVVIGAICISAFSINLLRPGREQDNVTVAELVILDLSADLISVFAGHHNIEEYEIRALRSEQGERLVAILRSENMISLGAYDKTYRLENMEIVVANQNLLTRHG